MTTTKTLRIFRSNPGIDEAINDVDQQINHHKNKSGQNNNGLHMREVSGRDGGNQKGAKAWAAKNDFDQHGPFKQEGEFEAKDCDDRYRGIKGKRNILFINPQDAQNLNLVEGQLVDLQSIANDNVVRKVFGFSVVLYDIPQGNIAAYYPETNPLVSINSVGIDSYTPTSKSIPVTITPSTKPVINVAQG